MNETKTCYAFHERKQDQQDLNKGQSYKVNTNCHKVRERNNLLSVIFTFHEDVIRKVKEKKSL